MTPPETRYARSSDSHLAFQVIGDGPLDLVFFGALVSHVELIWEEPSAARLFERLSSLGRLIIFDKRGVGMSDPVPVNVPPTLDERLEDVTAVMNAAGSEEAVLIGTSDGGQLAILFAVTYPRRTRALVLIESLARASYAEDYQIGVKRPLFETFVERLEADMGGTFLLSIVLPSIMGDDRKLQWWAQFFRRATSPGALLTQLRMGYDADIRHVLPLVRVPTLVIQSEHDRFFRPAVSHYLAENIQGARYVGLESADHLPFGDMADPIAAEVQEFLTGVREPEEADRVLATVMFTDIVGSTERAAALGDRRWRDLLLAHDRSAARQIDRFRGRLVKGTGDGILAVFEGPARAIRCGSAVRDAARAQGLEVRVGLHTGEIELHEDDIGGIAVHIGARVAALATGGEVLVSGAIPPLLVRSGIEFVDRGEHELKGVPGSWRVYAVEG
jgi:class 3 adenylate cyclase